MLRSDGGGIGGTAVPTVVPMPDSARSSSSDAARTRPRRRCIRTRPVSRRSRPRVAVIDQMDVEWRSIGRTRPRGPRPAQGGPRDPGLGRLVFGDSGSATTGSGQPALPHALRPGRPYAASVRAGGARRGGAPGPGAPPGGRDTDPFITRLLVQVLVPGLVSVASKLRWGRGGDWRDGEEFFGELLTTAWCVVAEWSGQDRPLCRARPALRHPVPSPAPALPSKDLSKRFVSMRADDAADRTSSTETLLDELARALVDQGAGDDMPLEELQVLYSHNVLGYSIAELASPDRPGPPRPLHAARPGSPPPLRLTAPVRTG